MYTESLSLQLTKMFYNNMLMGLVVFLIIGLLPIALMFFLNRFYSKRSRKVPSLWLFITVIISIPCSYFGDIALTYLVFFILGWGNPSDSFGGGVILGIIFLPIVLIIEIISVIVIRDKAYKALNK